MYIQYSSFDVLVRSAALFIVHAVSSHVDLTSLAELRVQETVPSCPEFFVVVFFPIHRVGNYVSRLVRCVQR